MRFCVYMYYHSVPPCLQGDVGEKGDKGEKGIIGLKGLKVYYVLTVHISYIQVLDTSLLCGYTLCTILRVWVTVLPYVWI